MNEQIQHMARGGKTFYFASLWLDHSVRSDAAVAYSFCRMVDDIADDLPPGDIRTTALRRLYETVRDGDSSNSDARAMLGLIERFPTIRQPIQDLIEACGADTPGILIENSSDLIRYAHGVAGTVGLAMYPILGGREQAGMRYAADLGVAMQCTNIARDVLSDLEQDRVYLPRQWLQGRDIRGLFHNDRDTENIVVLAVQKLLTLADHFYARGLQGLPYLHPRNRFAIRLAARCYGAIGSRTIRGERLARQRAIVPLHAKLILMARATLEHRTHIVAPITEGAR
jgi:phytoene synthase